MLDVTGRVGSGTKRSAHSFIMRIEPQRKKGAVDVSAPREVADLRGDAFENRLAPSGATRW
jgi:hypothetical protein